MLSRDGDVAAVSVSELRLETHHGTVEARSVWTVTVRWECEVAVSTLPTEATEILLWEWFPAAFCVADVLAAVGTRRLATVAPQLDELAVGRVSC